MQTPSWGVFFMTSGLSDQQAEKLLLFYGKNELVPEQKQSFFKKLLHILREPMFLLLLLSASIYFFLGEAGDGAVLLVFVLGVIAIEAVQEWKTDQTLKALKALSAPEATVIRGGVKKKIPSALLVPGDLAVVSEGEKVPADGLLLSASDLLLDESTLTGESLPAEKAPGLLPDGLWRRDYCYAGTLVVRGSGLLQVEQTGGRTEWGKLGLLAAGAEKKATPLDRETGRLIKICSFAALFSFLAVAALGYLNLAGLPFYDRLVKSLLLGVTLAMAMIPEEFPVVKTVFLSMGAWRLAKKNALVRSLPAVETLGAVSALCVDKTGTLTLNKMSVSSFVTEEDERAFLLALGRACESEAYDPMEKALLAACRAGGVTEKELFAPPLLKEYPFDHALKIMGHVYREDTPVAYAKGSHETLLPLCSLTEEARRAAFEQAEALSSSGLRVIALAKARLEEVPEDITRCPFSFLGLVGLEDPVREGIPEDIARCRRAGVEVFMITGDNALTAKSVARKAGIPSKTVLTGAELDAMDDEELARALKSVRVFARVAPAHKMRIVAALQKSGRVTAMTGDGVNDIPALKAADIGIAMGLRGSEAAREAADLILLDDNFATIVTTVRDGRRIYDNIKKSVGYIFSIHIPIVLSSLLGPLLKIPAEALFLLPLHVVLLELVIDPTCSIVFERQPSEPDVMEKPPRRLSERLFSAPALFRSLSQGFIIFLCAFCAYYLRLEKGAPAARSMGLAVLLFANQFLVQVLSSENRSLLKSLPLLFKDRPLLLISGAVNLGLLLILYTPLAGFLKMAPLSLPELLLAFSLGALSTLWYEGVKFFRNRKKRP